MQIIDALEVTRRMRGNPRQSGPRVSAPSRNECVNEWKKMAASRSQSPWGNADCDDAARLNRV